MMPGFLASSDRPDEAFRKAAGLDGASDADILPMLIAGFAEAGNVAKADELIQQMKSPRRRFDVALQAAIGTISKMKEDAKDAASQPGG
jgi:hypothetical protein